MEYWQFMAKDNVPFHSVVFPSTLMGTGKEWTLVNRNVCAVAFILVLGF